MFQYLLSISFILQQHYLLFLLLHSLFTVNFITVKMKLKILCNEPSYLKLKSFLISMMLNVTKIMLNMKQKCTWGGGDPEKDIVNEYLTKKISICNFFFF